MIRPLSPQEFAAFQKLIYELAGIYFAPNKRELLGSRLARRLDALGMSDYRVYHDRLLRDPSGEEREQFINCVTTNKTNFFREPHHFDFLRERVFPELRARVAAGAPRRLRIWSAASSTGEEPYSIAMVAHRELARDGYAIEIVASDIDTEVLHQAHEAVYTGHQVAEVPAEYRRYVTQIDGRWQIHDDARALVQLHQINLIRDRFPFSGTFDAIFVRNVIIYFDRPGQIALFQRLRPYLTDAGYLFLGHSESLLHITTEYAPAGQTVYRRTPTPARAASQAIQPPSQTRAASQAIQPPSQPVQIVPSVAKLGAGGMIASPGPVRIDAVAGPSVTACLFDPDTGVGGMAQLQITDSATQPIEELIAQLEQLGAARPRLRAKLVGGGGRTPDDRADGGRTLDLAEQALERAGIPIDGKRVGGDTRHDVQFFTHSGRLLCRARPVTRRGG